MFRGMSDETLDGILYGFRLELAIARNPALRERNKQYFERLKRNRELLSTVSREQLEHAAETMGLIALPGAMEIITTEDLIDRISRCMDRKTWGETDRPKWIEALGIQE